MNFRLFMSNELPIKQLSKNSGLCTKMNALSIWIFFALLQFLHPVSSSHRLNYEFITSTIKLRKKLILINFIDYNTSFWNKIIIHFNRF